MLFYNDARRKNARQKLGQERRPVVASCVWLEVSPRSTSDEFPGWVIIRDNSHVKNTLLSLNQGNFTKFCVAVSFTLVDLKFLIQQSLSLTWWPLRPTLAMVNNSYE